MFKSYLKEFSGEYLQFIKATLPVVLGLMTILVVVGVITASLVVFVDFLAGV